MSAIHPINLSGPERQPYQELAYNVIHRAVIDYRVLGRELAAVTDFHKQKRIEKKMKQISRFFLSDWYSILSGRDDGGLLLEHLDREVFGDD